MNSLTFTLRALTAALGRARYAIDGSIPGPGSLTLVRARWACGCVAEGERFSALALLPCEQHTRLVRPST